MLVGAGTPEIGVQPHAAPGASAKGDSRVGSPAAGDLLQTRRRRISTGAVACTVVRALARTGGPDVVWALFSHPMQCLLVATLVWLGPPEDGAVDPAPRGDPGDPAAQAGETQLQRPASQPSAEPRVRPKPTGGPETARPHADPDVLEGAVQVEPPRTQLPGVGGGPQPHMGNGLIVAGVGFYGIGATVFGLASLASGFASDTIGPKFAAVMAVGAGVAGLGLTSMGFGIRQRKKFNRWVRANPDRRANRGTGTGMLAGGVVALSGGVLMVSVATATPVTEGSPGIGYTLVLGGIGGLVSGTALIIAGPVLYDRFRQERERHQLNLTPTLLRDGGGLSLSGRF